MSGHGNGRYVALESQERPAVQRPLVACSEPVTYLHCLGDDTHHASKPMVIESAWPLIVNDEHWLTLLCTPTKLDYFALGFLMSMTCSICRSVRHQKK